MPSMLRSPDPTAQRIDRSTRQRATHGTRSLAWLMVIGGAVGLLASVVLTVEKLRLITNPDYVPTCDLNPIVSCGTVMDTPQASVFGFPNSLIGIAGYAVLVTVGVAVLAGASFARWFWIGLQIGVTAGTVFVHWLIAQSLWTIGALCPYCMAVWAVTLPLFWYITLRNARTLPPAPPRRITIMTKYHTVPLVLWYAGVCVLIVVRFWDYWVTQI